MILCEICLNEYSNIESLFRHLKAHKIIAKDYILLYKHKSEIPLCKCGCNTKTIWNVAKRNFNDYIVGHSAKGKHPTEEMKSKIGEKNSKNMKAYMIANPKIAQQKGNQLKEGKTTESELRRISSSNKTYSNMTKKEKEKFSIHSKKLWSTSREIMNEAAKRGGRTFSRRYDNGEFDFIERNKKISDSITNLYLNGGFTWARGTYETKEGNRIYYRSSWEKSLMIMLDESKNKIKWQYEPFSIKYFAADNTEHKYIPDFLITTNKRKFLIEVKPVGMQITDLSMRKEKAAKEHCELNKIVFLYWTIEDNIDFLNE